MSHPLPTSDRTPPPSPEQQHAHMLTVFSVSAAMVGVCLTGIGLIQVMSTLQSLTTLCDELLVCDAFLFLGASIVSYGALHDRLRRHYRRLRLIVDTFLMLGIALMVGVCGLIAWKLV